MPARRAVGIQCGMKSKRADALHAGRHPARHEGRAPAIDVPTHGPAFASTATWMRGKHCNGWRNGRNELERFFIMAPLSPVITSESLSLAFGPAVPFLRSGP